VIESLKRFQDSAESKCLAPRFEHAINVLMNRVTGVSPVVAAHKKLIVSCLTMADGRNHSSREGTFFKRPPGKGSPHPTTAPPGSMRRDRPCFLWRTSWKQSQDRTGHVHDEIAVIFGKAHFVPFALPRTLLTIRKALLLSARERSLRHQNALTFVAAT